MWLTKDETKILPIVNMSSRLRKSKTFSEFCPVVCEIVLAQDTFP